MLPAQKQSFFRFSFLSEEEMLLGASLKVQYFGEGVTPEKKLVLSKYGSLSIGLVFIMITFSIKLGTELGD
jgi:hypothetical protein